MTKTPTITEEIRSRIPEPRAIEQMIAHAATLEEMVREIHDASGGDWNVWVAHKSSDWVNNVSDYFSQSPTK
jgi:hypothetical protein